MKFTPHIDVAASRLKAEAERARDRAIRAALDTLAAQQRQRQRTTDDDSSEAGKPQRDAAQDPRS